MGLAKLETRGLFTYGIVVVDNDSQRSAESIVTRFSGGLPIGVKYVIEPRQSIARARNAAVANADGDFIAFIDDDEFPTDDWLLVLFKSCTERRVDGVLGPVKPHFDQKPPQWVIDGRFYERETFPTGLVIDWRKGRTNNVLLRRRVFEGFEQPFNPEFRAGEDQEFFHRAIATGYVFIWCNEAVIYEVEPPIRWKRSFMMRTALLKGAMASHYPGFCIRDVVKSLAAILVYSATLPFALIIRHDWFMSFLVRLCSHLGKVFAVMGFNPVKEQYVIQ